MRPLSHLKSPQGFTLIELLIVIAVLGVLAAGVLIAINPAEQITRTKDSNRKTNITQIGKAIEAFGVVSGSYISGADVNTWGDKLAATGELKTLPKNDDSTLCTSGHNQNNFCYNTDGTDAIVYVNLLSATDKSQCDSGKGVFYMYSTKTKKPSIVCTIDTSSEPSMSGGNYGDTSFQGPDGSKQSNAGISCRDIKLNFPTVVDGNYWIDPNGGDTSDAFQTFCDMTSGGWTRLVSLIDNSAKTNNLIGKGIKFTRFRAVQATNRTVYQEATFNTQQTASTTSGSGITADNPASTNVILFGPGGYGVYTNASGACSWPSSIVMFGSGYTGDCGTEASLKIGRTTGGTAALTQRFDVDLFVIDGAPI